jgi:hypothetical protein
MHFLIALIFATTPSPTIHLTVHDASGRTREVVATYSDFVFGAGGAISVVVYTDQMFYSSFECRQ